MARDDHVGPQLTQWLRAQQPDADDLRVEGLEHLDFGHSAQMMVFTIVTCRGGSEKRQEVVLRLRPPPPALLEPYDLKRQFDILRALEHSAVRVPRAVWLEDTGDVLGRPFLVMERVAGNVYEMEIPGGSDGSPECVRRMCEGMAEQLAAIHSVDLNATDLGFLGDGRHHLDLELDHWAAEMHRVRHGQLPALERLLAGLRATKPQPCAKISLVHGDAKPGNFAFIGGEVSAVFDWEMTTIGDPLVDIGWLELMWMQPVGITSHPAALSFEDILERYEVASGISPQNRLWYRALNAFKMAVICLVGAMLFDEGVSDDLKLVISGSGVHLLTQLGLADLGIDEQPQSGPVEIREERILEVQSRTPVVH
jgi:aminoglycoside phosphotransferase (APT) family kinase protein